MRTEDFSSASSIPVQFWNRARRAMLGVLLLATIPATGIQAQSKWRVATPRDTISVPANKSSWTRSRLSAPSCTQTEFFISGTFGIFPNQDSAGFDARYMYEDPSWNGPLPLANPPSWNGTTEQVYLEVTNNLLYSDADSIHVQETGYQSSHRYTALYRGVGDYFRFRIFDRNNQDTTGTDYALATCGLTIMTAQYTAGVSVQNYSLTFPLTTVGTSSLLLDSIASYGLDPLRIDSVWISGPQQSDFSVYSSPTPFTLPNESAHVFTLYYTPSGPDPLDNATLNIRCVNTGTTPSCDTEIVHIALSASGAKPNGTILQDTLDFGTERVNIQSSAKYLQGYNSGNADFVIDSIVPKNLGAFSCMVKWPDTAYKELPFRIPFTFDPPTPAPYRTTAILYSHDGKRIPITLLGNGAQPVFTVSPDSLKFDTVLTDYSKTLYDTVRNTGGWPAVITGVSVIGPQKQFFSFQPAADANGFVLNPGESRVYAVTFHPKWGNDELEEAFLEFDFDNHSTPAMVTLVGVERQPRIRYDTNVINFGRVEVGKELDTTDGVHNSSGTSMGFIDSIAPPFYVKQLLHVFNPGYQPLHLAFRPTQRGAASKWLTITVPDDEYQTDSILLLGYGAVPKPVFIPPSIDFGVDFDSTKYFGATTLTDTGDFPLSICDVSIIGPDASEFTLGPLAHSLPDTVLDSGKSSLTFPVTFLTTARAARKHHATLVVTYCDGSSDSIPLIGSEANEFVQFATSSATGINFGKVRVGTKADTVVAFRSSANNVYLSTGPVWIVPAGLPFLLAQNSLQVPPGAEAKDTVAFTPPQRGIFTGHVYAGGGNNAGMTEDSVPITGIGVQSAAALSTHRIDFGTVPLFGASGARALFLKDSGDYPLGVRLEKIGDQWNEFLVVTQFGDTINPVVLDTVRSGDSIFYSVMFAPRHPELPDHESNLVFNYDDGTTDTVLLIGRDSAGSLAFDRDTIDFGKVRIGTGPASQSLELVNTSDASRTATNVKEPIAPSPFAASPAAPITVPGASKAPLRVAFTPQSIGNFIDSIRGIGAPFSDSLWNSVILLGTGAAPIPALSVDTLDFDTVALGRSVTRSFTLSNLGNWPLVLSRTPVSGPNAGDFTPQAIPTAVTLDDSTQTNYSVTFTASTPLQITPRVGYLIWTMDNGDTVKLVLRAVDQPPYTVHIGFPHAYWGRPGDKLSIELNLQSDIQDTLGINYIRGTVIFDPTIVDGPDKVPDGGVQPGNLVQTPDWTPNIVYHYGSFDYSLSSPTQVLTKAGTLLTFKLALHADLKDGSSSPLIGYDTLPNTSEAIATTAHSSVFLDSTCGTIHILSGGAPIANYIQQNSPNPFGANSPSTVLPFAIGADNTLVTVRILDATGREVMRPVDNQPLARGRYEATVNAQTLSSGIYFYEFRAGNDPPVIGKMAVE